jgi:hypothetical protein
MLTDNLEKNAVAFASVIPNSPYSCALLMSKRRCRCPPIAKPRKKNSPTVSPVCFSSIAATLLAPKILRCRVNDLYRFPCCQGN